MRNAEIVVDDRYILVRLSLLGNVAQDEVEGLQRGVVSALEEAFARSRYGQGPAVSCMCQPISLEKNLGLYHAAVDMEALFETQESMFALGSTLDGFAIAAVSALFAQRFDVELKNAPGRGSAEGAAPKEKE